MNQKKFKSSGNSTLSPTDNTRRKELRVKPLKCWLEDYEKEIAVDPHRRYYLHHDNQDKLIIKERLRRYKLYVPLRSNTEIIVEVRFKIGGRIDPHDGFRRLPLDEALKMKPTIEKGVSAWNNMFRLGIFDPMCGVRALPIKYTVVWAEEDFHYEASVNKSEIREGVADDDMAMSISLLTTEATVAHEYAHCIGLPDEYTNEHVPEYISYIKPDGTVDDKIEIVRWGMDKDDPQASLMGSLNRRYFNYHAWNIAIEVQDLLREKLQRKIVCDIL